MGIINRLQIAYSGTLEAYGAPKHKWLKRLLGLFWTYKNDRIDASTRSAFYLIQAVAILKTKFGIHPEELNVHLWGSIDDKHRQWCKIYAVESYFTISGFENKVDSMNRLQSADLLFLPLERSTIKGERTLFIPGKLYDYFKLRKPILALCEDSDCKDLIVASGLGFCFEPDQPEQIAQGLFPIIKNPLLLSALKPNTEVLDNCNYTERTRQLASVFDTLNNESRT